VILTKGGAKLVDFGLATATKASSTTRETTMQALTAEGTIVGTLQYMSPEQVEGKDLDARSDLFSFGAMVYEMVTGRRAFGGATQASVITAIMSSEPPPMQERAPATPATLERVIRKCLAKDPDARWQSAGDVATALEWVDEGVAPAIAPSASRVRRASIAALVGITLMAITVAAWLALHRPPAPPMRFEVASSVPFTHAFTAHMAISPDGLKLAYVTTERQRNALWLRTFDNPTPRLLSVDNPVGPFWSPDSKSIGYFAHSSLRRVSANGGDSVKICDAPGIGPAGSWGDDDTIVFATLGFPGTIRRVPAAGGTPRTIVRSPAGSLYWPILLPGSKRVLYLAFRHSHHLTLHSVAIDGSDDKAGGEVPSRVEYLAPYLFFVRERMLMAQKFDPRSLTFSGEQRPIAGAVDMLPSIGYASFSVSPNAIATHGGDYLGRVSWFDHNGHFLRDLPFDAVWNGVSLSHDGSRVAVAVLNFPASDLDVWTSRADGSGATPITSEPDAQINPVWSPDDTRLAYSSEENGPPHIMIRRPGGETTTVTRPTGVQYVSDWSHDGKWILYDEPGNGTDRDIWVVQADGSHPPVVWLRTRFSERNGRFSPDDRWIAYASSDTGLPQAYIRSFDRDGEPVRVSTEAVGAVRWSADGKEIYYSTPDEKMYAVSLTYTPNGIVPGTPRMLFALESTAPMLDFDVARDGRFLLGRRFKSTDTNPITVTLNWR
jgi:Tol biopolymer transport system component